MTTQRPQTLAELRASGWRSRTVKEELRANLHRAAGDRRADPSRASSATRRRSSPRSRTRSSPDRTSSSSASAARPRRAWPALLVELLDEWLPVVARRRAQRRPVRAGQPVRPRGASRQAGDATPDRLAAARPALRREAGDARHHDRRPHRRGRPDQGRRGPLPVGRADDPLRADPAREPRHLRDQRAARPRRADPGRPAQHPRGARRPDPRLHRPAAARPVRGRVGQPGGLHEPRPDHHAAQGPPRLADPDPLPAHARARDGDRAPGEAALPGRGGRPGGGRAGVHGGARGRADAPRPPLPGDQPALRRQRPRLGRKRRGPRGGRAQAGRPPRRAARRAARLRPRCGDRLDGRQGRARVHRRRRARGADRRAVDHQGALRRRSAGSPRSTTWTRSSTRSNPASSSRSASATPSREYVAGCSRCPGSRWRSTTSARST